jgi:hypothetical protein
MGDAVALVRAVITDAPTQRQDGQLFVPFSNAQLLAGELPEGPAEGVQVSAEGENFLTAGTYLLLLGDAREPGGYFMSNGLRGSFVVSDQSAREQCPDYDHSGRVFLADSGIVANDDVIRLLQAALTPSASSPPPRTSSAAASTSSS